MEKVNFYGVALDLLDTESVLNQCNEYLNGNKLRTILFLNAHYYNLSVKDENYKRVLNSSDLLLNDGIGIRLGLKFKGLKEKENMNGTDLIPKVIEKAAIDNKRLYLLGGREEVSRKTREKIASKYGDDLVVGNRHGFFENGDNDLIIKEINNLKVDILLIGMGAPMQEKWLEENKDKLETVKVIIAGGAILDFISESVPRAPIFMRKLKLEWLFRLYLEPKRLYKRYLIGNVVFFYNIYKNRKSTLL